MINKEQVILRVTAADTQRITLDGPLMNDNFCVRWVQIVGANYPTELQYYVSVKGNNALTIGSSTTSNLTTINGDYNIIVPLTAATSVYSYDTPYHAVDRAGHGHTRLSLTEAPQFHVRVSSNVGTPTFTELTVCLESM